MRRILVTSKNIKFFEALRATIGAASPLQMKWSLEYRAGVEKAREVLSFHFFSCWFLHVDEFPDGPTPSFSRLLRELRALRPGMVVVLFVEDPFQAKSPWLEAGVDEIFPLAPDGWSHARTDDLLALVSAHTERLELRQTAFAPVGRRGVELLGLNALVHGLSNALDRSEIVHRALTTICGLCRKGAVAFLDFKEQEEMKTDSAELFSSEIEDGGRPDAILPPTSDSETPRQLRLVEQLAHDRLLVCLHPKNHSSWDALFEMDSPLMLRQRPEPGLYPGLEPLWHRFKAGFVFLVPVQGVSDQLGVIVIGELDEVRSHEAPFSEESLVAMSALLGSALENARLFDEISEAYRSVQRAQERLVQTEKFAAVGLLSAQIAHEINNPSSFVISNLSVMRDYVNTIVEFFIDYEASCDAPQKEILREAMEAHEVAFLQEDLQTLLDRSMAGMQRIHQIIQDLRYFAHDPGPELNWVNLESLLDASLNLIQHELKHRARIERDFQEVPNIFSDANKLSQVFLNLLVNASQALANGDAERDYIRVGTLLHAGNVLVFIEDSGEGIPQEWLARVFEPFFTTKRRGEGTGLGLSITREILHSLGGDIRLTSEVGKGTRIEIMLPIRDEELVRDERVLDSGSWRQPPELRGRKATPSHPRPAAPPPSWREDDESE